MRNVFLATALLLLLTGACNEASRCPAGAQEVEGKCRIIDPGRAYDFVLPDAATSNGVSPDSSSADLPADAPMDMDNTGTTQ